MKKIIFILAILSFQGCSTVGHVLYGMGGGYNDRTTASADYQAPVHCDPDFTLNGQTHYVCR